jgi:hypothetical protein
MLYTLRWCKGDIKRQYGYFATPKPQSIQQPWIHSGTEYTRLEFCEWSLAICFVDNSIYFYFHQSWNVICYCQWVATGEIFYCGSSDGQRGFRPGYSCESQRVTFSQDIADSLDKWTKTDMLITDFSKALDLVILILILI